ncbi:MAG: hypothetical protein Aurels2KO_21530 [Aureliella sp.]
MLRDSQVSPLFYMRHDLRRQSFFAVGFFLVSATLWLIGWNLASVSFLAYFLGRVVRDIQWWRALSREWSTTAKVVDWPHVESIAKGKTNHAQS